MAYQRSPRQRAADSSRVDAATESIERACATRCAHDGAACPLFAGRGHFGTVIGIAPGPRTALLPRASWRL